MALRPKAAGPVALAVVLVSLSIFAGTSVHAQLPPTIIPNCGFVIDTPGFYAPTNSLSTTSQTQDCITVNASGVIVDIAGVNLTGPGGGGSAAGIHVMPHASAVVIAASSATISGFGTGILVAGNSTTLSGGTVQNNASAGVMFTSAQVGYLSGLSSLNNGGAGIELSQSNSITVLDCQVTGNGGHGLWLRGSRVSALYQIVATGNGASGIYLGCSPEGPIGSHCGQGIGPSSRNTIVASAAQGNKSAGIAIDFSDSRNLVTGSVAAQNGSRDAVDENAKCDNNSWTENQFATTSQSCIR
ncbi:MAG: right-handed parallel beta-helix repeat-containing protein [Deltaproteobacteria bacterium]|nr:right-handed parallel beta-helix repeat-containing protein [Deltaproteobacteria bacterium]